MQKNVSPIAAVIVILAVIAVAAFFWVKYSAGPSGASLEEMKARAGGGGKGQQARKQPSGARRGSGRALKEAREKQDSGAGAAEKPAAKPEAKPTAKPEVKPAAEPEATKPAATPAKK